jgi:hypothetical protein
VSYLQGDQNAGDHVVGANGDTQVEQLFAFVMLRNSLKQGFRHIDVLRHGVGQF